MTKNEIGDFIRKSIEQVKSGLPDGCSINGNFDFEVAVQSQKEGGAEVDIVLVNAGMNISQNTVHKIRFSITDRKSMEENAEYAKKMFFQFMHEFKDEFKDEFNKEPLDRPRRIRSW